MTSRSKSRRRPVSQQSLSAWWDNFFATMRSQEESILSGTKTALVKARSKRNQSTQQEAR